MVGTPDASTGDDRDTRISEIFYYFEKFTTLESGRKVGRKIGVVQEILIRKYLEQDEQIRRRMYLEQALRGASGAKHKVEFSFHPLVTHPGLNAGDIVPDTGGVRISQVSAETQSLRLRCPGDSRSGLARVGRILAPNSAARRHLNEQKTDIRVVEIDPGGGVTVDVVDRSRLLASIESKRVGAQRFSGSTNLGSGIQTIEKAKQASLVAIDLDLEHNGNIKPLQSPDEPKQLISIVALGNGVHWTDKDKAILGTYVDFTWLVRDKAIIRYAEYVRSLGDNDEDFLNYFSKYFDGMTKQPPDDFTVTDDDFKIIAPVNETRSLREVIHNHIVVVDSA